MGILREVLAGICAACGKDKSSGWLVASYKDKKDFAYLWSDEFLKRVEAGEHRNLVVVWDGMPEPDGSGVNILDHITPVDWAMALSHHLLQESKKDTANTIPELRILICDISQQNHASAFSVRMLPAICHGMPWLRVYRPMESDNWFMRNFEALVDDIKQFGSDKFPSLKDAQPNLVESLVHAWIGSVAESGSHHDVSNLLGPMVLSTGLNSSSLSALLEGLARIALLTKLIWLDIGGMGGPSVIPQDRWFDFAQNAAKIVCDRPVKIILIDDQANQGWLDIVSAAVGVERTDASQASGSEIKSFSKSDAVEVWASTSYQAIKDRLEKVGISDKEGSSINGDQRFKFSLTGEEVEILLLDLRLFFNEQDEIDYFKWALGVARNLKHTNRATFPDMATDKLDELRRLIEEAEDRKIDIRKTTAYIEFLTLLPRILATIDMSLPIVIFSSTGQRQVTEAFKPYGNIITVFEKPRFFGYTMKNVVQQTANKFRAAMIKALGLVRARSAVQGVQRAAVTPRANGLNNQEGETNQYVEVFIDESGTVTGGLFVVGGIALVHKNRAKAEELDTYMGNYSFDLNGVNYNLRWNGEQKLPKHFDEFNPSGEAENVKKLLPTFESVIREFSTEFFTFSLSSHFKDIGASDPLNNTNLDNVYLRLVREVVDALAYEFLPHHINGSFDLKICAATRLRVKGNRDGQKIPFTEQESDDLRVNYGINVQMNGTYSSMQPTSLVPIMADIVASRPHSNPLRPKLTGAIAVALNYEDRLSTRFMGRHPVFYRNAHHLADIVAYFARVSRENPDLDILSKFGDDHMADDYAGSGFPEAIYAGRCLDAGDLAEALLFAHIAIEKDPARQFKNGITSKVCLRISNALGNMTPDRFMVFATGLDDSRHAMRIKRPSGMQEEQYSITERASSQIRLTGLTIADGLNVLEEACKRLHSILGDNLGYRAKLAKSKNSKKPVIMLEFDTSDAMSRVRATLGACKDSNRFWGNILDGVL